MLPLARFDKNMEAMQGNLDSKDAEEKLRFTNILLRAEMESSPDGILVVDPTNTHIILFNRRFIDMMGIPPELVHAGIDAPVLATAPALMKDPEKFLARVQYLNEQPDEAGYDELETKDGRFIEHHSAVLRTPSNQHLG